MSKDTQKEIAAPDSKDGRRNENSGIKPFKKLNLKSYFTTKRIAQVAVFVALALVMKMIGKVLTFTPAFTVTFVYIPWLLSGIVLGPAASVVVCLLSDILGNFITVGMTGFNPITMLSNSIYALPIAILYLTPIKNDYLKIILGSFISLVICTLGIGSLALYTYYSGMDYLTFMLAIRSFQVIVWAVNVVLLCGLVRPLQKVKLFPQPKAKEKTSDTLVFWISLAVATVVFAVICVVYATFERNLNLHGLEYVAFSLIYLITASVLVLLLLRASNGKNFMVGFSSIVVGLLSVVCGIIIYLIDPLNKVGVFDEPRYLYYLVVAIAFVVMTINLIVYIKDEDQMSRSAKIVNIIGIAVAIIAFITLSVLITVAVTTVRLN